ncbi:MAG: pyridoxamine 5'-phosphate oxidase family protein, partial [Candidatus Bathyarchaeota archaeon]
MNESSGYLKSHQLPKEVVWLLEEGFFGYLGTSSKDKKPHVTPIIFVFDGCYLYFLTAKIAKKLRNMKSNSKVALLIDIRDPSNIQNNRAVMLQGTVKLYSIPDALLNIRQLLKI